MNPATAAAATPGRMFLAGDADDEEDDDEEEEYDEDDGEAQEVEEEEVVMDDMVVLNDPQQQHQPSPHVLHPHVTLVLAHPHMSRQCLLTHTRRVMSVHIMLQAISMQ